MSSFGWKSPFPLRLGGGHHKKVQKIYNTIRANTGSSLSSDPTAPNVLEDIAAARTLAVGHSMIDRRVNQSDPMKLTDMLERKEAILQIVPLSTDSGWTRRRNVTARTSYAYGSTSGALAALCESAFDPWTVRIHFTPLSEAVAFWPGDGSATADKFWTSTVALFVVEYIRPINATDEEVQARKDACMSALDQWVAAWASFDMSETQSYGTHAEEYGFYLDQPNLDVSCFSE